MKLFIRFFFSSTLSAFFFAGVTAHAFDRVILQSGEQIEGNVLTDVPLQPLEIQTSDGQILQFDQDQVANVIRNVNSKTGKLPPAPHPHPTKRKVKVATPTPIQSSPSELSDDSQSAAAQTTEQVENNKSIFIGITLGGLYQANSSSTMTNNNAVFNIGGRIGFDVFQMGEFSKISLGGSLTYSEKDIDNFGLQTLAITELVAQLLFRKVSNTGFYFGPEMGVALQTFRINGVSLNNSTSAFDTGALIGYDYHLDESFSIGPELHLNYIAANNNNNSGLVGVSNESMTIFKFLATATLHF